MKHHLFLRSHYAGFWVLVILTWVACSFESIQGQGIATSTPVPITSVTPAPTVTAVPTVVPSATLSLDQRVALLEEKVKIPPKDGWDIFKIIADVVTALLVGGGVALFSVWATRSYNNRQLEEQRIRSDAQIKSEELRAQNQLRSEEQRSKDNQRIAEIQTVQEFIPSLQSNDPRAVEAALLAIASLGNEKLAGRLAELFRNEGALSALNKMAASSDQSVAEVAERSLNEIYKGTIQSIVQISQAGEIRGTGFFVRDDGYILTTKTTISGEGGTEVITSQARLPGEIVTSHEEDNFALLRIAGEGYPILPISDKHVQIQIMDEVILIGHDIRVGITIMVGRYLGLKKAEEYKRSELYSIQVHVQPTIRGAVAFDMKSNFLGMVVMLWWDEEQGYPLAYLLPANSLKEYLKNALPPG